MPLFELSLVRSPQDNYFMPILTAGEVVDMAADFLLPQRFSNDARRQQACDTMEAMGLSKATNTLVRCHTDTHRIARSPSPCSMAALTRESGCCYIAAAPGAT